jgi:3-deoxy-manno-octulosonate cytidylyltransferase (CMP-KDO synthetase)
MNICVIPARMAASRFPGKPIVPILGLEMIRHIYLRCRLSGLFDHIIVATCDEEIELAAKKDGAWVIQTSSTHERCTDRVTEAVHLSKLKLDSKDFILMVQGDEVAVSPDMMKEIVSAYQTKGQPSVVNLAGSIHTDEEHESPNVVKVVMDQDGRALYMSRCPIPYRLKVDSVERYKQTGIIGFQWEFLKKFSDLSPTKLEKAESCDMMRAIEHGYTVQMVKGNFQSIGVDVPQDVAAAEQILRNDLVTAIYL